MTQTVKNAGISAGTAVLASAIGAIIAVGGVAAVFGGYKQTVDAHSETLRDQGQELRRLNQQVVTKDDFRKLEEAILRLEGKVDSKRR